MLRVRERVTPRFLDQSCVAVAGAVLYRATRESWSLHRLTDRAELPAVVEQHFNFPSTITREAVEGL